MTRPRTVPKSVAKRRLRQARAYQRRREYALAFLGATCASCAATEGLEIDHVNPAMKRLEILGSGWSTRWQRWQRWHDELEKCQLLCVVCHAEKTATERANPRARISFLIELADVPF